MKRVLFSLAPAGLLLALLVVAEGILRLVDPDPGPPLMQPVRFDGTDWLETNRAFLAKYFPSDAPTIPEFKSSLIRRIKAADGFRVICLGSSSMFGTPYDMNGNIPGIVRRHLRRVLPGREVEVLNLGASAINSNVVRDFVPGLDSLHPDLILIYMGHNEFYGPDGVGASWVERHLGFPTRWKYGLRELRLLRLGAKLLPRPGPPPAGEASNLMKQVSQGQLVSEGSEESRRIVAHFAANLEAIVRHFRDRGIPVIVSEVSSNMMFPPFVPDTSGSHSGGSVDVYGEGMVALAAGDTVKARGLLDRAREIDLLKFRAPSAINDAIRGVCASSNVPLVRGDSLLRAWSPGGITGDRFFWEHLHPTLAGYYTLAYGFIRKMEEIRILPLVPPLPLRRDSLRIAWFEEAYADVSIQHLTGRWPFEGYRRAPAVIGDAAPPLMDLVRRTYRREIPWNDGCYRSATYFWSKGDLPAARTTYEAMLEEYPASYYTNYLLATLLNVSGEEELSVRHYRRSIASNGGYPKARIDLGLLLVQRGLLDEGSMLFEEALEQLRRGDERELRSVAMYGLAAAYAKRGEKEKALRALEGSLGEMPGNRNAESLRRQILGSGG